MHLRCSQARPSGFSLPDLLACIALCGLVVFLALPTFATNTASSTAAICLRNQRQLTVAWQLYATDNGGRLVQNFHGGDAANGSAANRPEFSPWASGWLTWGTDRDNTNTLYLRSEKWARLAPYLNNTVPVHKCPADRYLSASQRAKGWPERVRTVSMNGTLGHINFARNSGPWDPSYSVALRTSDLIHPGPADTFVFIDEHPDSINDPFIFPPSVNSWIDVPGNLHHGATTVSFADGHAEVHPWSGSLRTLTVRLGGSQFPILPNDPDRHWLSFHSQRTTEKSY